MLQHSKMANRSGKIEELWPRLIEKKLVTALKIWKWGERLIIISRKKTGILHRIRENDKLLHKEIHYFLSFSVFVKSISILGCVFIHFVEK